MNIIPVIDLQNGLVVAAKQGQRKAYKPIKSNLSRSSSILDIIDGFLSIFPFKNIYIADLNAITGSGNNQDLINIAIKNYSSIEFWVDTGINPESLSVVTDNKYRPILGSESQTPTFFNHLTKTLNNYILSLDFFPSQGYVGPKELFNLPDLWPIDIIIMSLDRVGQNFGPDMEKLQFFCKKYPSKNFIAAGGIRHEQDLINLKKIGIQHALVASALHSGEIDGETLRELNS